MIRLQEHLAWATRNSAKKIKKSAQLGTVASPKKTFLLEAPLESMVRMWIEDWSQCNILISMFLAQKITACAIMEDLQKEEDNAPAYSSSFKTSVKTSKSSIFHPPPPNAISTFQPTYHSANNMCESGITFAPC